MGINFIDPDRLDIDLASILLIGEGGFDPAVLIDDTAGAGATGKTWSANKLVAEFAALRALIEAGGTDPDPGPGTDPDPETYTPPPFDAADAEFGPASYVPPVFSNANAVFGV
jgi:hypothetical protein